MDTTSWAPRALALLRIVTALLFIEHATVKFFAFPAPFPMPGPLPPLLIAAAAIELIAGLLIALGLFTRIAAFVASGEMAVGYFMMHGSKSFWPVVNQGEAAILFCFIFLFLAAAGPGAWALDLARSRRASAA
ncbi:MAG TPA: DoxX family protein [Sphingomicrobium sp.]